MLYKLTRINDWVTFESGDGIKNSSFKLSYRKWDEMGKPTELNVEVKKAHVKD